jgi:hypothetical protein
VDPSKAAAALGRLGGKAGTGKAKVRGDSAYYKALRAKAKKLLDMVEEIERPGQARRRKP